MSEPTSREGTMFGPYRLLRLLGKGGMGEVYEAQDTVKDRTVALKVLPESVSHDPVFRKRLQREAHSAGRLQEPHVVPIHDYGEIDGILYVDMRMISGADLRKVLKSYGPMTPARAVAIVRQIASALDAAHEAGVMHRDVKPENILINREDFAYLVDFGIANAVSDEKLTELGTAVGTYAYMAPERFTNGEVTYRADIYALACVLHECLTGAQPFTGDSVSVIITAHLMQPIPRPSVERPGIPEGFDAVIAKGMAKKPEDRYATAGDLAAAATDALTAREQDQAATILQRSERATTPVMPVEPFAPTGLAPTPPPGATPPPYGVTPATVASTTPPPYGTTTPPPYGTTTPPPYGTTTPPPYGSTPPAYGSTPPPPPPPAYGTSTPPPYGTPPPPPGVQQFGATPPPGGPPAWNQQGIPGSSPGGGKKTPWIPIAAIGGVILIALAAIGVYFATKSDDTKPVAGLTTATNSPTSSSRASATRTKPSTTASRPTDNPDSFEAQIFAILPESYPQSVCQSITPPAGGALATVDCEKSTVPGGPDRARYSLYPNINGLNEAFTNAVNANDEQLPCPGSSTPGATTWSYNKTPDVTAGQLVCGTFKGNADITWSYNDELIMAEVQSSDLDSLHNWWNNDS
jgi:serine/threonine-protein kinase